jgi:tetratricopeptide (TPR) repeat protein
MNKNTIEYLAYLLNKAHKEKGREKAIVFLGAGTSVSAGIPLTNVIVRHIKKKCRENPIIKEFTKKGEDDYYKLMGALTADERRDLFHFYVTRKRVKLNITNIYLAQLLKLGYVDYIVTVNFDDLILRACTLYNFLPPVYDISNIKTITTTDIRKNSVIYLHGQYFGQWLLNNPDELQKVEDEVLRLFNAIKTRRTWIIVGYSGNDGIFDKIKSLGSFSSELFWVKKKLDEKYDEKVINFLQTENLNANKIEGYYADSFFLKLYTELSKLDEDLKAPEIISKPFTFVKSVLQSINEIKENDELNDNVKKMLRNCNERIDKAIAVYENEGTEENLKQRIFDAILKQDFNRDEILSFENEVSQKNYQNVVEQLSWYYNDWGNTLLDLARVKNDEVLFKESFEKYQKASELYHKNSHIFFNWGNALLDLARIKNDEVLYRESFEKYKRATEVNIHDADAFYNWGSALLDLAKKENDEVLFMDSFEKFKKASKLDPENANIYINWGSALLKAGALLNNTTYYDKALEIAKKGYQLNGNPYNIACAYALSFNKEKAFKYLKETLDKELIAIEHINQDNDWDVFRNDEDFVNLINQYKVKHKP